MTGFRVHRGCAQARFGIEPDLSCFGKVIGGGLPAAAYGGRAEIMEKIAPTGPIYQAGTLSGNPLAMRAGIETLDLLDDAAYARLETLSSRLQEGLDTAAREAGVAMTSNRVGSMMTGFFGPDPVTNYSGATACDAERYGRFFHGMLEEGVYLAPSQFEAAFVSLAHTEDDIDATIEAARKTHGRMAR